MPPLTTPVKEKLVIPSVKSISKGPVPEVKLNVSVVMSPKQIGVIKLMLPFGEGLTVTTAELEIVELVHPFASVISAIL